MDAHERLETLINLAREIGVEVRRESLGGESGGLCLLKRQRVLFVDLSADTRTQYEKTVAALAGLPELAARYLPPEIREDLDRLAGEGQA